MKKKSASSSRAVSKSKTTARKMKSTPAALKAIGKKQTRLEIIRSISEETGLSVKDVRGVFIAAGALSKRHIMKRGSGEFAVPEMGIKINRKTKPATKKRMGRNPATGEAVVIAAKPKRDVIKVRALKVLKDVIQ